ncbi:LysR family transcriptional regulator [Moraxella atlantae]|uniref:LysR family transcriptional regulator n=1 Tax=Faucicola atlantae TaxID=34059 RepID=A0A1B8QAC4_9GAMM|nr:LysR family transcriptional regulator [Moraxella atlantae]OBX76080.1 LysR family transcriptional regulator [Moraxella atlantae]
MIERTPLNGLKFFYFCGLYGSVTVAADKLHVTQSAVSKQIKNLEDVLHIKLFIKVGRKLSLTKQGEILFACCEKIFLQLDDCLTDLTTANKPSAQLVLSCEPTISMKWLIPRLVEFNQLYKEVDIVLLTGGGKVEFEEKNVDLAIRRNDFDWGEHIYSEKLADEYIVAVNKAGAVLPTNEKLILTSSRPNLYKNLRLNRLISKQLLSYEKNVLEHFYLCIEAALANLGTAIVSIYMVEREINHGLLRYASTPVMDGSAYYLLSRYTFEEDPRKVVFKEWLKIQFTASEEAMLSQYQYKLM